MEFYLDLNSKQLLVSNLALDCASLKPLKANDTDAAKEKHVPVVEVNGSTVDVTVGTVLHPMTPEHLVTDIILVTNKGYQVKHLTATDAPKASFALADGETAVAVYEYCNLHGLWVYKF